MFWSSQTCAASTLLENEQIDLNRSQGASDIENIFLFFEKIFLASMGE